MSSEFTQTHLSVLYRRLEKPVFNIVYRWLWNVDEAADIVQEAFLRVWRMRERIDLATVDPLVYRIATNLARNRRRTRRIWKVLSLDSTHEDLPAGNWPDGNLGRCETEKQIRRVVESLPDRLKQVVFLCEFSGMTYEQVAQTLSIPVGTVGISVGTKQLACFAID